MLGFTRHTRNVSITFNQLFFSLTSTLAPDFVKYYREHSRTSMVLDVQPNDEFYAHFEKVKEELVKQKEHWEKSDAAVLRVSLSIFENF